MSIIGLRKQADREGEHDPGQLPDLVMGYRPGQSVVIAKPKHSLNTPCSLTSAISHVGLAQQLAEQLNYASQAGCLDAVWYELGTDGDLTDSRSHLLTSKRKISYLNYDLSLQQCIMVLDVGDILR